MDAAGITVLCESKCFLANTYARVGDLLIISITSDNRKMDDELVVVYGDGLGDVGCTVMAASEMPHHT